MPERSTAPGCEAEFYEGGDVAPHSSKKEEDASHKSIPNWICSWLRQLLTHAAYSFTTPQRLASRIYSSSQPMNARRLTLHHHHNPVIKCTLRSAHWFMLPRTHFRPMPGATGEREQSRRRMIHSTLLHNLRGCQDKDGEQLLQCCNRVAAEIPPQSSKCNNIHQFLQRSNYSCQK